MADFQYYTGSAWADVPALACPEQETGAAVVVYPAAEDVSGAGAACGAFGLPRVEIRAERMYASGLAFWNAFLASATTLEASGVQVTAWDPWSGDWVQCSGTLLRPAWERALHSGAELVFQGVTIVLRNVTVS
jgi:hypothetical protein